MLNNVILIGRLTADPELRHVSGDVPVVNFTLAVDKIRGGEKKANFFRIVAWRSQAENVAKYLGKGSLVAVEGALDERSYDDKEGLRRNIVEVIANSVQFLDSKKRRDDSEYAEQDSPF